MTRLAIVVALLFVAALPLAAQSGSSSQPSLSPSEVYLWNSTTVSLKFLIESDKCTNPLNASLNPDNSTTFTCDGANFFNITLNTQMPNGSVVTKKYSLAPTKRYQLFADNQGVFDVAELQAR